MKNNKRMMTMVITLCALVLLFIVYKAAASMNDQKQRREAAEEAARNATVMIADYKYTDAVAITYQKKGEQPVAIKQDSSSRWVAASDETLPISQEKAAYMANALSSMGASSVVNTEAEDANTAAFGLDDPAWTFSITYKTDNVTHTYRLGAYNEFSKSYYFAEDGVDKVYMIVDGLTSFFEYDLHSLADAGKFPILTQDSFRSVDITMAGETVHAEGEDVTTAFLDLHNILQPSSFIEYHVNDTTKGRYGLIQPQADVAFNYIEKVTYTDSEGATSSSTVEQNRKFTIHLGDKFTAEDGTELVPFLADGYTFIYSMPASAAESMLSYYAAGAGE